MIKKKVIIICICYKSKLTWKWGKWESAQKKKEKTVIEFRCWVLFHDFLYLDSTTEQKNKLTFQKKKKKKMVEYWVWQEKVEGCSYYWLAGKIMCTC